MPLLSPHISDDMWLKMRDPLVFARVLWPHLDFYDKQWDMIYSVEDNDETVVVAGNMLGKDFTAAFITLKYFLTHHPVRIVTTSVKDDHLRVLWGEMGRYIDTSVIPLKKEKGGPLIVNHRELKKVYHEEVCSISYCLGMVSERAEGLAGHHAPYTLATIDEASGVSNTAYTQMGTWAKRMLIFGNPNQCNKNHFFRKAVEDGDIEASM